MVSAQKLSDPKQQPRPLSGEACVKCNESFDFDEYRIERKSHSAVPYLIEVLVHAKVGT